MPEEESPKPKRTSRHEPGEIVRYSGPIPPADELARYEGTQPGAADRLIAMAEREQAAIIAFRNRALLVTSALSALTIVAIAYIMSLNALAAVVVALALAQLLPPITELVREWSASRLDRQEREIDIQFKQGLHELDIQIRREQHELDMIEARKRLAIPTDEAEDDEETTLLEMYGDAEDSSAERSAR